MPNKFPPTPVEVPSAAASSCMPAIVYASAGAAAPPAGDVSGVVVGLVTLFRVLRVRVDHGTLKPFRSSCNAGWGSIEI